jgi:hypothetical protein
MRGHDHDHDAEASFRPKGDRIERDGDDLLYRAASAGRTDVLGQAGLLGLQRTVGNAGVGALMDEERSSVSDVVGGGGGRPLDADTRTDMENRFGQDFGDVRVHTDGAAHDSAKSLHAQAYTVGSDIVFQGGRYDPGSDEGRHTLAHELTHVVQQRSGPVDGTDVGGGLKVSDPADRFEREASANADSILSASHGAAVASAAPASASASVQRDEEAPEEDEATAQTYVQRDGEEEDEEPPAA